MSPRLLRWPEAAVELGWEPATAPQARREAAGRRLRDAVMAAEQQTGQRIATRLRGRRQPKTRITLQALHRHLPELKRNKADQLAADFRGYLDAIDEKIADGAAEAVRHLVDPRIRELLKADADLQEKLAALAQRLAASLGAPTK